MKATSDQEREKQYCQSDNDKNNTDSITVSYINLINSRTRENKERKQK